MTTLVSLRSSLLALTLGTVCLASLGSSGCAVAYEDDGISGDISEVGVRGHFDLYRAEDGQYYFEMVAGNGQPLLFSHGYTSRTGALGGLLSVLDNGGLESRYQIAENERGESYLELRAGNGRVIATSDPFFNDSNARRGVDSCVRAVAGYLDHWSKNTGSRFDVFEGADGSFYFRLVHEEGDKLLRSQGYVGEASALNGAFAVAEYGVTASAYDVRESSRGGYYFNVRAPNNQIIATSQVYQDEAAALEARDEIIALLPTVELL
jgi:hypothetical protein